MFRATVPSRSPGRTPDSRPGETRSDLLRRADEMFAAGAVKRALLFYAKAVKEQPGSCRGWLGLACCRLRLGSPALAEAAARRAAGIAPSVAHSWQILSETSLGRGAYSEAAEMARAAAAIAPGDPVTRHLLAKALFLSGKTKEARKILSALIASEKTFSKAYFTLAELLAASGDAAGLRRTAEAALLNCSPGDGAALLDRVSNYLLANNGLARRFDAGSFFVKRLLPAIKLRRVPCPPRFYEYRLKRGLYPGMREGLRCLLKAGDTRPSAELFRACCCAGKYRLAFETAESLLSAGTAELADLWNPWLNDRNTPASFWNRHHRALAGLSLPSRLKIWRDFYLGVTALYLSRDRSQAHFARLRPRMRGRYAWMRFPLGYSLLSDCRFKAALTELKAVRDCLPGDWMGRCKYGEALICAGRRAQGFREFRGVCSKGVNWKAEMLLLTGRYAAAARLLEPVIAGLEPYSRCWLGAARFKLGEVPEAERWLRNCVDEDASDLEAAVWLAEVHMTCGRPRLALPLLARVLKRNPSYDLARVLRALLFFRLGRKGAALREAGLIDAELRPGIFRRPGRSGGRPVRPAAAEKALRKLLAAAGGNRRPDKYFLKIGFPAYLGLSARAGTTGTGPVPLNSGKAPNKDNLQDWRAGNNTLKIRAR